MNADYVENIIRNIDKQSYKCILVDGAWGIGKSYMVKKALEDMKDRTCFISLFGMDDCQKIYHEALFQFAFRTSRGGKIASGVQNFAKAAGNFCAEVSNVSNALAQAISERELFAMTSEKFKKNRIIVIDDLERRKSGLDLEELFGVIEDLKQLNYIKIILIANSKEICNEDKEVFDKYREKIIDRSFDITEHSESIKWFDFGIDGLFIEDFLSQHRVRNLRTLKKAQDFYDDVKQYCSKIKDERFMNEIKGLCFAVVVENTDKLYFKDTSQKSNESIVLEDGHRLSEHLCVRLANYARLRSSNALLDDIYNYYTCTRMLDDDEIGKQYEKYKEERNKPNYYKTDEEINDFLKNWKSELSKMTNSIELTRLAGNYDFWFDVMEEDDGELIKLYKTLLQKMFKKESETDEKNLLDYYSANEFHSATKKIRDVYDDVLEQTKQSLIKEYIERLCKGIVDETSLKYSYLIRSWYTGSTTMHKRIDKLLDSLYRRESFPVDNMNEQKRSICYNILTTLYLHDKDRLEQCYNELKGAFGKTGRTRTEDIFKEIKETN